MSTVTPKKPDWLKIQLPRGTSYVEVKHLVTSHQLHTVCESARCPNIGECWSKRTATFMIMGDICSRNCRFCAVKTGKPLELDRLEPVRIAEAVSKLKLRHAVITSVTRDDLKDSGASVFAETIRQIRQHNTNCRIEILTPDFNGNEDAFDRIIEAEPDIMNHNIETVPRLYKKVRPQARYERSLYLLDYMKKHGAITKSGLMVGIGEQPAEVIQVMKDLRQIAVDLLTIGQYLQPTSDNLPIDRYVDPSEFNKYKKEGMKLGFTHVESGPLVRSSYHADEQSTSFEYQ